MHRRPLVLALLLLVPLAGRAGPPDPAPGVLTRPPAVIQPAEPEYPEAARAEGIGGAVTLELTLSDAGEVVDATVTGPAGHGFDEAALAAARRLRFSPAEIDGKPAAVVIEYRFTFELRPAPPPAPAEAAVNLRGQVLDRASGRPVAGALVVAGDRTVRTDADGRFALAGVPEGSVHVAVAEPGHEPLEADEAILAGQATEVTYRLAPAAESEYEAVVVGQREQREVSHVAISAGEIKRVPGTSGDAVKVILNLPGVARTFMSGELVLRGGNPHDTRVYVDGQEVPQVFHFGGLTSVYSSELLQEVELQAGNHGVRSGRAIGGRVNLATRDPGDRPHALADMNLYHATALVEARPADDLGVALAARRSYADALITAAARQMEDGPGISVAPRYYDVQAKVAWHPTPDDTFRLDAYGSDDRMVLTGIQTGGLQDLSVLEYGTRFYQGGLRWEHRAGEDTRLRLAAFYGWQAVTFQVGDVFTERDDLWRGTFRAEVEHALAPWLRVVTGLDGLYYPRAHLNVSAPGIPAAGQVPSPNDPQRRWSMTRAGGEGGAFLEATVEPTPGLLVVPGVRADLHQTLTRLTWVDPRAAVRWTVREGTVLKGAAGLYHQAPQLVYMTRDWGNPDLTAEGAWQFSAGVEQRLLAQLSLDVELYDKELFHLAIPSDGTVVRDGQPVPERFRSAGTGRAYGAELLLRWNPDGRFFGWIAYSLSRTKRDQAISGGRLDSTGDQYDQPHNVVAVGTWDLPDLWRGFSAGFRARYTSGNRYVPVGGAVFDADADQYQSLDAGRLSGRMPAFFQLDLRADKKWVAGAWALSAYVEIQNVTNRKNVEGVAYNHDYSRRGWVNGLPFFPAFGLRAEYGSRIP